MSTCNINCPKYGGNIRIYLEQIEFFFTAVGVKEDNEKKATLFSQIPQDVFNDFKNLIRPATLNEIKWTEVVSKLANFAEPEKSEIVARFEFDQLTKRSNESVQEFSLRLLQVASFAKFSDAVRDERLRDRFVAGIKDSMYVKVMLSEKFAKFDEAVTRAMVLEKTNLDTEQMSSNASVGQVYSQRGGRGSQRGAWRGVSRHPHGGHQRGTQECYVCGSFDHFARVCPKKFSLNEQRDSKQAQSDLKVKSVGGQQ